MSVRSVLAISACVGVAALLVGCGSSTGSPASQGASASSAGESSTGIARQAASISYKFTVVNELKDWWDGPGIPLVWKVSNTKNEYWDGVSRPDHAPPQGFQGLEQEAQTSYSAAVELNSSFLSDTTKYFTLTPSIVVDGQEYELMPVLVHDDKRNVELIVGMDESKNVCRDAPASSRQFSQKTSRGYLEYQYDFACGRSAGLTVKNIPRNR